MGAEWSTAPFGQLVENFDSIRVPVKEADRKPGRYPYYGASGVVDHVDSYIFDGEYLLVAEDGENLKTRQTPIAFLATGKFWVNNHAHIVRANADNDTRFLMYAMRVADIGSYLTGSTMPKLTQANMNRVPVVAPPLAQQRAIARILGALDDKIELNRKTNATLEAMARALFKSWFVDFDPVRAKAAGCAPGLPKRIADLFPESLTDSAQGESPQGWGLGCLSDSAGLRREQENPLDSASVSFRHFSIPAFDDGQRPQIEFGASIRSAKWRVPPDAILLSKLNPSIERVWFVDVEEGGPRRVLDRVLGARSKRLIRPVRTFIACAEHLTFGTRLRHS